MDDIFGDDKHFCIKCRQTIAGLENYVLHRKKNCSEFVGDSRDNLEPQESDINPFSIPARTFEAQHDEEFSNDQFANDAIDLSITKRDQSQNMLFPSMELNSTGSNKVQRLHRTLQSHDSYLESFPESDVYASMSTSRDQSLFLDYRLSMVDQTRRDNFLGQNTAPSSSEIYTSQSENCNISLFRSFDQTDIGGSAYLAQSSNRYGNEESNFENKLSYVYQPNSSSDNFLSNDNNSENVKSSESQSIIPTIVGSVRNEITSDVDKEYCDPNEPLEKNSSLSEHISRQNMFFSSLELKNITGKVIKYESDSEDEDDFDDSRPPSHYTGGKWPPGCHPGPEESAIFSAHDDFEDFSIINQHTLHPPHPSYTKGKWLPGKRMTNVKYETSEKYKCKPCNKTLSGKAAYEKHLSSQMHIIKENGSAKYSSPAKRPSRATKEKAREFLKKTISLIKNKTHVTEIEYENENKSNDKNYAKSPDICDDRSDDDLIDTNSCSKLLCPICQLLFSKNYFSRHFASLAHIHNELQYNKNPDEETSIKYQEIVLGNILSLVKASTFICRICSFCTNVQDDFQYHLSYFHKDDEEMNETHMKIIYRCSACPEENTMHCVQDVIRHLQVPMHQQNIIYDIFQGKQIILSCVCEMVCSICHQKFRYNKAYLDHRRKHHNEKKFNLKDQRSLLCSECPFQGVNERVVRSHLRELHNIDASKFYFCFVCGKRYRNSEMAVRHRHSVSHKITLQEQDGKSVSRICFICYEEVENLKILRKHIIDNHIREITPCHQCGLVPPLRSDLKLHRESCAKEVLQLNGAYKCELCPFSNDLLAHVLMHTVLVHAVNLGVSSHCICTVCNTKIKISSIKNHMLLHTNELKFSCNFCSRKFSQKHWLQRHLLHVHSSEIGINQGEATLKANNLPVDVFHSITHVKRKKKLKFNARKHLCEICGKSYTSTTHLKRHQNSLHSADFLTEASRSTTNESLSGEKDEESSKKFVCEMCGEVALSASELRRHRNLHRQKVPSGSKYLCPHCDYSTVRMFHLKRHLRLHTGSTPFKCHYCSYSTNNQENLRKHMIKTQKHSGRSMYECQFCGTEQGKAASSSAGFGSNYANDFKRHLVDHHKDAFKDKDELLRHIRSYYVPSQDLFSDAIPAKSKRRLGNSKETLF